MFKNILITFFSLVVLLVVIFLSFFNSSNNQPSRQNYRENYTDQELQLAAKNIYPKAKTPELLLEFYSQSLEKKEKLNVKMLSMPREFLTTGSDWDKEFDKFWEKYQGQTGIYSPITSDSTKDCEGSWINFQNQKEFVCTRKIFYGDIKSKPNKPFGEYWTLQLPN